MKCQHHGFYIGVAVWPAPVSSAMFVRIVDTARLRADGVLMFVADAPLRSDCCSSSKHPTLQCATMDGESEETTAKGIVGEMTYRPRSVSSLLIRFSAILCGLLRLWMWRLVVLGVVGLGE